MRHKVVFQFNDYDFNYDETITRKSTRFFNDSEYTAFMQDIASDTDSIIISDESISDMTSRFFYALAYIVYLMQGYRTKAGKELFYHFMDKAFIYTPLDSLCEKFDAKGYNPLDRFC